MMQLQTGFLPGSLGSLHISLFYPAEPGAFSHWVIHVPAFGEEMNKSRGMVARQARALAARGMTVLVPDLFGTGDSAGSLSDATWQAWKEDIAYLVEWARGQGATPLTLWGHRLGCLLAVEAAQSSGVPPEHLLLWQPVHSGKQHMTQFLRLRMAASLASGNTETVAGMRQCLLQGEHLEVAGYTLSGGLFSEIESLAMAQLSVPAGTRMRILETSSEVGKLALPVTARLVDQWSSAGIDCRADTALGDPFWMTQELSFAPGLIEKTTTELLRLCDVSPEGTGFVSAQPIRENTPPYTLPEKSSDGTQAVVFKCGGEQLAGVLHHGVDNSALGVVIVVGGPQYRVGSHRQFVYMAQSIAESSIPVLRFDYRGMGDSSGELQGFEHINFDIRCAIDALQSENPNVTNIVIWGLCDAATAAVFYAASDTRVKGLVLANPWVYSEQGSAKAYLKYYYVQRLFQREFWSKVFSGKFRLSSSFSSAKSLVKTSLAGHRAGEVKTSKNGSDGDNSETASSGHSAVPSDDLVTRFSEGLAQFSGEVFFIISGKDLTAAEFVDASHRNRKLQGLMGRSNVTQVTLPKVDHTFSRAAWRAEVETLTLAYLQELSQSS